MSDNVMEDWHQISSPLVGFGRIFEWIMFAIHWQLAIRLGKGGALALQQR